MNQLESALVIALRNTIKWESAVVTTSGTLTPVDPTLPFDASVYQARDRQLAYRDLIVSAAVVEVAVQVSEVWNCDITRKPTLQGPAPFSLPFVGTEAGTYSSQIRHVLNTSIPFDAARYADADLYGRDSVIYEILARACEATFSNPSIPRIDSTGTVIPNTSIWSLGEGSAGQVDINASLPLNRDLFKQPDQNLADRDNQLAGYVAHLAQVLKNPFEHANRLYVQIEAFGTVQREPDTYALITDDGTNRVYQADPALPNANQIIYNIPHQTLQWIREQVDELHVPQIYAMSIPGIEVGQVIETLAQVPDLKDAQYWRGKAGQLSPEGIQLADTDLELTTTNNDLVDGGVMQYGSASFTVPDVMTFALSGSIGSGDYRISVLAKPNTTVEIAGAQNITDTSGTLGGATFEINVPSGSISNKIYLVQGGDGIVYNGSIYTSGDVFSGTSALSTYAQYGITASTIRQYAINFTLALPAGPWNVRLEYTNLTGTTEFFALKAEYVATGAVAVPVIQDIAPLPFTTSNGNIMITPLAGMDVNNPDSFSFPIYWTGGDGQLHIRKVIFESAIAEGRYVMTGTFNGSTAQVDVTGEDKVPGVLRWQFVTDGTVYNPAFTINYTDEPLLPIQIQQVQVQQMSYYVTTPLSRGFQSWRQECLDRAERVIVQGYNVAVAAFGTDVPTFRDSGSVWSPFTTEDWMSFVEVYNPRVREVPAIAQDSIIDGFQYEVDTPSATYDGTVYTTGQKFYGVYSAGTVYTGGTVHQVGALIKSQPGHLGKPALVPRGIYFDDDTKTVKAYYDTPYSPPQFMACQPWMIEQGFYVAQDDFWMPETQGASLSASAVPVAYFVGVPTSGDYPLAVSFFFGGYGGGDITYLWDFGD